MKSKVTNEINRIIEVLKNDQSSDGSWDYPFETGVSTDAYMIILLRTLEINDEKLIQALVERILSRQEKNGSWKLFYDEKNGDVTATVEAYYALLYSGYRDKGDKELVVARRRILEWGGIEKSHMLAKIMLALTGQYKWPTFFPIPVEFILLPVSFPINFFDFSVYGRANIAPMLILADQKFTIKTKRSPDLSNLFLSRGRAENDEFFLDRSREWRSFYSFIQQGIKNIIGLPEYIHTMAIQQTKKYIVDRIEPDGTFYNYFSSTFLMIFSLLALRFPKNDPIITKAVDGLKGMACQIDGHTHMQFTTVNVWNTSLINYALQRAGISWDDPMIQLANDYLLSRQHYRYGDWVIHNPTNLPGGWGFSDMNTMNPDIDDTTASLRSITHLVRNEAVYRQAWDRGINWIFSMQNHDGGWAAFEKNVDKEIVKLIPIEGAKYLLTDPSTADLTGRTLEFYGNFTNLIKKHNAIKNGVNWLKNNQEKNGSWYGRWGICYIYGTWAAITGMVSTGVDSEHSSVQKSLKWLRNIQNPDGGWGESCYSDINEIYTPLGVSTLTHTAWALDALIAASDKATPEIQAGVKFILDTSDKKDWTLSYPKGQAMAGGVYIHYHSYRYIFPLLALSHYRKKFLE
ncbi:squalene--hopene cyclase [Oceanobacillus zhaokaii]|uniref:Squalene--hopene cyclase n=1 Tax=Oceanobacillus zhaokaii TaxID=2052660 RepID=A0A345PDI6_9BACI|nr:prenyltransferase/squalene oxidase repeat-containing protein [Oceanobacillus zhaokaii]AXI08066.1 squalene--hopene cyclase [Oceanobacillus zhaokaii]